MTSPLTCPNCGRKTSFREIYGPGDQVWLQCSACGAPTDDAELAAAQEPEVDEPEAIQ